MITDDDDDDDDATGVGGSYYLTSNFKPRLSRMAFRAKEPLPKMTGGVSLLFQSYSILVMLIIGTTKPEIRGPP